MQRMTKQRKTLYEAMEKLPAFFDAQDMQQALTGTAPAGMATVYRFLNTVESKGELHSFLCENRKVYSTHMRSHAHFTCERCGSTKHFQIKQVDFLKALLEEEICHFQVEVSGICTECLQKEAKESKQRPTSC